MGESINGKQIIKAESKNSLPVTYSSLALAYIGDAVYELMIRKMVLAEGNRQVNKLHRESTSYVNAAAQAKLIESVLDELTDDEMAIYKRGRNAVSHTTPKNQSVADYRKATGFEALVGYLHLSGDDERIRELFFRE